MQGVFGSDGRPRKKSAAEACSGQGFVVTWWFCYGTEYPRVRLRDQSPVDALLDAKHRSANVMQCPSSTLRPGGAPAASCRRVFESRLRRDQLAVGGA